MSSDCEYDQARLAKTEQMIEALEDAILKLAGGAQSYEFDDGQTRVRKSQADLEGLRLQLRELETRRDVYKTRLCGGATHGFPGF